MKWIRKRKHISSQGAIFTKNSFVPIHANHRRGSMAAKLKEKAQRFREIKPFTIHCLLGDMSELREQLAQPRIDPRPNQQIEIGQFSKLIVHCDGGDLNNLPMLSRAA